MNTYRERPPNVAYRYRRLIEWSDKSARSANMRAVFRAAKGMDYEQYAEVVVYLDEYFWENFNVSRVRSLPEAMVLDPLALKFLRSHSVSPDDIDRFLGPDPMRKLRDEGFHQAMEKPFLRMDGEYYLLHTRAMENALGPGVFYAALPRGGQQEYYAIVGQFFQQYMGEVFGRISDTGGYVYSGEVQYVRSADRERVDSSDHFLFRDGALFFLEDRFTRVSKLLLTTLDPALIEDALKERVFVKFEQLSWTVAAYLAGDFEVLGVNRADVRAIYPLIVVPHAFPRGPAIQQRFDREIADKHYMQGRHGGIDVRPYEIAEAEAFEGLAGLSEPPTLAEMLDRKFGSEVSQCDFFKNHLILREGLELKGWSEDEMRAWYRSLEAQHGIRLNQSVK